MSELVQIVCDAPKEVVPRYVRLYREAAAPRCFYILLEGSLEHSSTTGVVPEAQRVQSCGAAATAAAAAAGTAPPGHGVVVGPEALSGVPRVTTATALTECHVLRFSCTLSPDAIEREFVRCALPGVPLFMGVSAQTLSDIAPLVGVREVADGEDVLTHGVVPSHFCILMHGSVEIVLGNGICVAKCSAVPADTNMRNPSFGEMGLLANKPAMAFVRATSTVKCLTISGPNFARFLDLLPDFEERLKTIAKSRARENENRAQMRANASARAAMLAVDKAEEVLALPQMQQRERMRTSGGPVGLASVAAAMLCDARVRGNGAAATGGDASSATVDAAVPATRLAKAMTKVRAAGVDSR